jgi:hypothetical protein
MISRLRGSMSTWATVLASAPSTALAYDDASAEQIRPLLPGTTRVAVLVTSRSDLRGLTASHAARTTPLDVLAPAEARALLANTLGAQRVGAEPEAGERLADRAPVYPWRCASPLGPAGHSPTTQPNWPTTGGSPNCPSPVIARPPSVPPSTTPTPRWSRTRLVPRHGRRRHRLDYTGSVQLPGTRAESTRFNDRYQALGRTRLLNPAITRPSASPLRASGAPGHGGEKRDKPGIPYPNATAEFLVDGGAGPFSRCPRFLG